MNVTVIDYLFDMNYDVRRPFPRYEIQLSSINKPIREQDVDCGRDRAAGAWDKTAGKRDFLRWREPGENE